MPGHQLGMHFSSGLETPFKKCCTMSFISMYISIHTMYVHTNMYIVHMYILICTLYVHTNVHIVCTN
jgi:hypothetical protein